VGGHVLIVEDDRDLRELLTVALESEGHTVRTAENGVEALVRLQFDARPDVILLNLVLPAMTGGEVLEAIRRDPRLDGVPVVLITGAPVPVEMGRAVDAVLAKPFGLEQLRETVEELLARRVPPAPTPPPMSA
jgi:two-component system, chemotaxis family, chemotaxis protein CheY